MKTREEKLKSRRAFYRANRDRILAAHREYAGKHREKKRESLARWRKRFPERAREISRKANSKLYGITIESKKALVAAQKGRCAVCGDGFVTSKNTHVDHVHGSNPTAIRGILCRACNVGLGNFKDSPERLIKAAAYILKFQNK